MIAARKKMGIAAKIFGNSEFGYYKVNIERPDRRKAQFTEERIASLRFDKALREPMEWAYKKWGDALYDADTLNTNKQELLDWCEENDLDLTTKNRTKLTKLDTWTKHQILVDVATDLMGVIGSEVFDDFNIVRDRVDAELKAKSIKLSASDKKAILDAVSWYDEDAAKVIKKRVKLPGKS